MSADAAVVEASQRVAGVANMLPGDCGACNVLASPRQSRRSESQPSSTRSSSSASARRCAEEESQDRGLALENFYCRPVYRGGKDVEVGHSQDPTAALFAQAAQAPTGGRDGAEPAATDASVEAEALFSAGNWHLQMGSFEEAVLAFRMAAKRAEDMGDFTSQVECLQSAACALLSAGALKEAVEVTNEVLAFWEEAGSPAWPKALTLTTLAKLHLGLLEEAGGEEEEGTGPSHSELALQAADLAAALLEEVMKQSDEETAARASQDLASAVHIYGRVCLAKGDGGSALYASQEARRIFTEVEDQWGAAAAAVTAARACLGMQQLEEAREAAQWAREAFQACGNPDGAGNAQGVLDAVREQCNGDESNQEEAAGAGRGLDYSRFDAICNSSDEEELANRVQEGGMLVLPAPESLARAEAERPAEQEAPAPEPAPAVPASAPEAAGEPLVLVRFLYSSPLLSGEQVRALDVRADLQALKQAKGICTEVRVATVERLREALFARPSPGILHISAHCISLGGAQFLVLEDAGGAAYMMAAADLAAAGPWDDVELLVFLSCGSEAFARELVRLCGLRRSVCCSIQLLDRAAHLFMGTFYQALGNGRALLSCHEIARAAVRGSSDLGISSMADKFVLLGEPAPATSESPGGLWTPTPMPLVPEPWPHWPLWPRVEDFVGRQSLALSLVKVFEQRRAVCLWGARGLGKTAFCHEFCHHFSAPGGRRFSAGAFLVDYTSAVRGANGDHPDAFACAVLAELRERGGREIPAEGPTATVVRQELRTAARQLDQAGPWLLVLDGLPRSSRLRSGSHSPSSSCFSSGPSSDEETAFRAPCTPLDSLHGILDELLCSSARLCVLLTARSPLRGPWAALGLSKVVEVELPPIAPEDAARLFARRAARPFYRRDFGDEGAGGPDAGEPLLLDQELLRLLMTAPLFGQLAGSPGRVLAAAAEVHTGLPSLLRHPWLLPAAV
mmetsp:Transcript_70044/g.226631  ORF Transcript_70044/g.226631 Transcript_70044/m.226631 type:complete len:966 (+) Transcript_70044:212-3109(+)